MITTVDNCGKRVFKAENKKIQKRKEKESARLFTLNGNGTTVTILCKPYLVKENFPALARTGKLSLTSPEYAANIICSLSLSGQKTFPFLRDKSTLWLELRTRAELGCPAWWAELPKMLAALEEKTPSQKITTHIEWLLRKIEEPSCEIPALLKEEINSLASSIKKEIPFPSKIEQGKVFWIFAGAIRCYHRGKIEIVRNHMQNFPEFIKYGSKKTKYSFYKSEHYGPLDSRRGFDGEIRLLAFSFYSKRWIVWNFRNQKVLAQGVMEPIIFQGCDAKWESDHFYKKCNIELKKDSFLMYHWDKKIEVPLSGAELSFCESAAKTTSGGAELSFCGESSKKVHPDDSKDEDYQYFSREFHGMVLQDTLAKAVYRGGNVYREAKFTRVEKMVQYKKSENLEIEMVLDVSFETGTSESLFSVSKDFGSTTAVKQLGFSRDGEILYVLINRKIYAGYPDGSLKLFGEADSFVIV